MGRITIASYRPKPGKERDLLKLVKEHMPILQSQQLITDRVPIVMQAGDKTIIEIFEWKSRKAIDEAHTNPAVQELWNRFNEVCDYEIPLNVKEFHSMFAEFEPIN